MNENANKIEIMAVQLLLKDRPEGVPVMAAFLLSDTDSGIEVDDMKRQQFWAVNENLPILSRFTVCGK